MTIQLKTGDIVDFNLLPKPKFKVGDIVWIWCGLHIVESVKITELDYEVHYFDNGYTSRIEYDIYYVAKYDKVHEQNIYSSEKEAIVSFNKWKLTCKENDIVQYTKRIRDLTNTLEDCKKKLEQLNNS